MWAYELGPLELLPDRRDAEHDDARRRGRSRPATRVPARLGHPARAARAAQEGRTRVARIGRHRQLRHVAPSRLPARIAVRVFIVRVPRVLLGREQARSPSGRRSGFPAATAFARAAVAFLRGLWRRLRGRHDHGPADAPDIVDCVLDLVRGACTPIAALVPEPTSLRSRAEILLNVKSYIEANLGNPALDPADDRAGELHLDAVPAQAVRGGGDERRANGSGSARLDRCRRDLRRPVAREPDDPGDREPLGAAGRAALQPPLPLGVRMLAERLQARGEERGRRPAARAVSSRPERRR